MKSIPLKFQAILYGQFATQIREDLSVQGIWDSFEEYLGKYPTEVEKECLRDFVNKVAESLDAKADGILRRSQNRREYQKKT